MQRLGLKVSIRDRDPHFTTLLVCRLVGDKWFPTKTVSNW